MFDGMEAQAAGRSASGKRGRRELFLVFASGFATLLVEIVGAKLQGPFFGNSHFVWTNQILVTLLALAAGAWLGGRLADRGDGRVWFPLMFHVAAGWLCLLLPVLEKANYFFLRFHVGPGAILASAFFYFVPLTALGAAPPLAAAALIDERQGAGRVAGRVFGVATHGGVAGCAVAGGFRDSGRGRLGLNRSRTAAGGCRRVRRTSGPDRGRGLSGAAEAASRVGRGDRQTRVRAQSPAGHGGS